MVSYFENHRRYSLRLAGYDYSHPVVYFVTIITKNRLCLFANTSGAGNNLSLAGKIVQQTWDRLPNYYPVTLDQFAVMPNHVHGIIFLPGKHDSKPYRLSEIIQEFKIFSNRKIGQLFQNVGFLVWQKGYYNRVIRSEGELNRIRIYIQTNSALWVDDRENPASKTAC